MAKVIHLSSWFLLGCIASSTVAWLGAVHPALQRCAIAIYIFMLAVWVLSWLADDAISPYLKLSQSDYYGVLIALGIALVIGGLLQWLLG